MIFVQQSSTLTRKYRISEHFSVVDIVVMIHGAAVVNVAVSEQGRIGMRVREELGIHVVRPLGEQRSRAATVCSHIQQHSL